MLGQSGAMWRIVQPFKERIGVPIHAQRTPVPAPYTKRDA